MIGLAGAAGLARFVVAATSTIDGPAVASAPAVRLGSPPGAIPEPPPGKLAFPVEPGPRCYVLDNFGDCRDGATRAHLGVDILDDRGQDVYAVKPGVLSDQFTNTGSAGYGWTLRGDDGNVYRYMHLDGFASGLAQGARVAFGDVLGTVGSTGNDSPTNTHLHFEVRINGVTVDPLPLLHLPPGVPVGPPLKGCL